MVLGVLLWALTAGMIPGVWAKYRGKAPRCTWPAILAVPFHHLIWTANSIYHSAVVRVVDRDPSLGIERVAAPERQFWMPGKGGKLGSAALAAYLLTEHSHMSRYDPARRVRAGDVVLDCGAHAGVFTAEALRRGAAQVIAIEPDPLNLECLRRNFPAEIAAGNVVVYPKGVWNEEKKLRLFTGRENSGMNSVVFNQGAGETEISVTTIDRLVAELGLARVTYIKLDVEGAEREALSGAQKTLRRFRPRLMLDGYHRPGDDEALPRLILAAQPDYNVTCGPCQPAERQSDRFVPHVIYFE